MNKEEYMKQLKEKLRRLPKDDFTKAVDYYEEYFADAGEENEAQAIEDLGSPQMAADQIIREFAIDNSVNREAKKDVKKGISGAWIALLAVFASPIALPLLLAGVAVMFAMLLVVFSVLLAFGTTGIALVISAPVTLIGGVMMVVKNFPVFLVCMGGALIMASTGVLMCYVTYLFIRKLLYWIVVGFGKIVAKGEKKNEGK